MKRLPHLILMGSILAAFSLVTAPQAAEASGSYHHGYRHYHRPPIFIAPPGYHLYRGWAPPYGRVEIEVEPSDAQVFVDGNFVGPAKKLDGWPSFLWLRQGTYQITLVHPEHKTVTHNVAIFPRQRMTLDTPMEPGESTPPPEPKKAEEVEVEEAKAPIQE